MQTKDQFIYHTERPNKKQQFVVEAVFRRESGESIKDIAAEMGLEQSAMSRISRRNPSEFDKTPPDSEDWEYKPLWIRRADDEKDFYKIYVREDGKIWRASKGKFAKFDTDVEGYKSVALVGTTFKVHRLVLHAFYGPPKNATDIYGRHIDGIAFDNFYTNLLWGSLEDNAKDKIICGRQLLGLGKNNPFYKDGSQSKLADGQILFITRKMVFDAGHRIPFHFSKCRNVHGHTFTLEAKFFGLINEVSGDSSDGMLIDFGDAKEIIAKTVTDIWDHAFLVWRGDKQMLKALNVFSEHNTVIVDMPPTSEYLAQKAFININTEIVERYGFSARFGLYSVKLQETSNCFAEYKSRVFNSRRFDIEQ